MDEWAGFYVHVPFCCSVCPYCDFAVLIAGEERRAAYLAAIGDEIRMWKSEGWRFDTVYLGGGTPSSLEASQLETLLTAVRRGFVLADTTTVYLEVNPEHVSDESARRWREIGVGTVSLGVQSLDDSALAYLGRRHDAAQAEAAFETLRRIGFDTVSVDLIFGLEGLSSAAWRRQLDRVVELGPDHISCYQLTFHAGTVLGRRLAAGQLGAVEPDREAELLLLTHQVLADAGYEGYEVSNFARSPVHRSRHNMKYWSHVPYLGLGPSAHSFRGRRRWWNRRKLRLWQAGVAAGQRPIAGEEVLSPAELAFEAVMLGLRTSLGVDLAALGRRHGLELEATNRALVDGLCAQGLVRYEGARLVPTFAGMAVADSLARAFEVGE